jgi:hypothetical protein
VLFFCCNAGGHHFRRFLIDCISQIKIDQSGTVFAINMDVIEGRILNRENPLIKPETRRC